MMTLVLLKLNGKMLVKWLSDQFWRYCSCIYVLIETADAETQCAVYITSVNKTACLLQSHRDVQNMQDSYLNRLLLRNIYKYLSISRFDLSVMTYFWLIHPNFDKFCDIPC